MRIGERIKKDWPILSLIIITFLISVILYPYLPDKVPSHWNIRGEVDAYSSKLFGVLMINLMNLGLYFLFLILPNLDPKKENYVRFSSVYNIIRYFLHVFFVIVQLTIIFAALGFKVDVDFIMTVSVGIMFILFGNVMGKIKHNYFVGIRTPWTLADERVWIKTHRFAAPLWVMAGFIMLFVSFKGGITAFVVLMISTLIAAFVPLIYSYKIYKELNNK
ncbi:MAG: SdpI family protein [Caloramator sp.]|nr:SdpI family protein [Caloramator sp.]